MDVLAGEPIKELQQMGKAADEEAQEKTKGFEVGYELFSINGRMLGHGEPIRVDRLSRFCADAEHLSCRCAVCFLRIVSRDIPRCRQGTRVGFRAGASARKRHRLVQHYGRPLQLVASVVAGLLWDRVGHAAVFYYGAAFALVGSFGLLLLIPGKHDRRKVPAAK